MLLFVLIPAAVGRFNCMEERWETAYQRRAEPLTWPIRSSTEPHKLLPLLPRPILSSSILKLIRLPASLLPQIVQSIKCGTTLLPLASFSQFFCSVVSSLVVLTAELGSATADCQIILRRELFLIGGNDYSIMHVFFPSLPFQSLNQQLLLS